VVPWLIAQGGGCDCEVLANLEDRWGARAHRRRDAAPLGGSTHG
jgi:hypothetical protein